MPGITDEKALEDRLLLLEKARSWSPRLIPKLEALLRSPDDGAVFRVNPVSFAESRGIAETEAVDLFLHATKLGLFSINWQLLCPGCGHVVQSLSALRMVGPDYLCDLCNVATAVTLDDYIEVSFTVAPEIRTTVFHRPDDLPIEEFYFQYQFSPLALGPGGKPFVEVARDLQRMLAFLPPGETTRIDAELAAGIVAACDRLHHAHLEINVAGDPEASAQCMEVSLTDRGFVPGKLTARPGKVSISIRNETSRKGALLGVWLPPDAPHGALAFEPFLTAKKVINSQTFRDLFRSETIGATDGLAVRDLTVLFTDLKGSTELYDSIGDLKAFALVQMHFHRLSKVIQANGGAIVKTIGDAIMASFLSPVDGVRSALQMLDEIESFNREHGGRDLILKIGVHKGASIAVTLNERLDFFGQTVNIASRVQGLAGADQIYVTEDVREFPGVAEVLAASTVHREEAQLKGIRRQMSVYRIEREPAAAARV